MDEALGGEIERREHVHKAEAADERGERALVQFGHDCEVARAWWRFGTRTEVSVGDNKTLASVDECSHGREPVELGLLSQLCVLGKRVGQMEALVAQEVEHEAEERAVAIDQQSTAHFLVQRTCRIGVEHKTRQQRVGIGKQGRARRRVLDAAHV